MSSTQEVLEAPPGHIRQKRSGGRAGRLRAGCGDVHAERPGEGRRGPPARFRAACSPEWGKPGTKFELKQETVDGNHAYMFWNAETADNIYEAGQDAFVVLNGKIVAHFFSAKITPKAAKKP